MLFEDFYPYVPSVKGIKTLPYVKKQRKKKRFLNLNFAASSENGSHGPAGGGHLPMIFNNILMPIIGYVELGMMKLAQAVKSIMT